MAPSDFQSLVSYDVYETTHGILLKSQFLNRDDVNDYIDRYTSSSHVYVYRTSCVDVFYPLSTPTQESRPASPAPGSTPHSVGTTLRATPTMSDYDVVEDLVYGNMVIRKYGKGYRWCHHKIIHCTAKNTLILTKWWSQAQGWFSCSS